MATVVIAQGTLRGGESTTDSEFKYFEFLGIPYAKPPIDDLRFKSPQPPEPWEGIRDATNTDTSTISCQMDLSTGTAIGSEDCLYLNVYTPKLLDADSELKPVMVLSHGGGFVAGNGTVKNENGPDYLIENDVVVVTFNYRLGAFGFLCLEIPKAAGNMGLKDHVRALQWIQENIGKFGGDKNNVTICGVSAGSASCEYLLLSSRTKGLYHKCILESGSSLNPWAINIPNTTKTMAVKLAQGFGYEGSDDDVNAIFEVLFKAPASELTSIASQITAEEPSERVFFGFVPVIEKDLANGEAFLLEPPYRILNDGKFNQVPVIRGFCNKEGTLVSAMKPNAIKRLVENKTFTDYWPHALENNDVTQYNSKMIAAYIEKDKSGNPSEEFAIDFFGDLNIVAGVYLAGKLQCKKMSVYMYKFCYDGNLNMFKTLFKLTEKGAAHSDESGYLVRHVALSSHKPNDTDILMRTRMTKMWTNFAKTGNPTPDDSTELPMQWPLFKEDSQEYLNIDEDFKIEARYESDKMAIFEDITRKYSTRVMSCPCYDS